MHFEPPFLDLSQAREIAADASQLQELVQTFAESMTTELSNLENAWAAHDLKSVQFSLHALKGFVPLFCNPVLAKAVIDLYHASAHQPIEQTQATYRSLAPALQALQKEVEGWLGAL